MSNSLVLTYSSIHWRPMSLMTPNVLRYPRGHLRGSMGLSNTMPDLSRRSFHSSGVRIFGAMGSTLHELQSSNWVVQYRNDSRSTHTRALHIDWRRMVLNLPGIRLVAAGRARSTILGGRADDFRDNANAPCWSRGQGTAPSYQIATSGRQPRPLLQPLPLPVTGCYLSDYSILEIVM